MPKMILQKALSAGHPSPAPGIPRPQAGCIEKARTKSRDHGALHIATEQNWRTIEGETLGFDADQNASDASGKISEE